jgi:hypothetical protein
MPSDSPADVKLEIGHVPFIDIVGYSKLLINYMGLGEKEEALDWLEKSY